jgi:CRISPR/Cas system CMR-associated protein Cmr1 (group 7 of RAMP superfamily)
MHKLEVTLKQHTPLIHFQHDQEGATLRTSEVKPKLDKFIKAKLKELDPQLWSKYIDLIDSIPDEKNKVNSPYKLSIQMKDELAIDKYVIGSFIPKYKIVEYENYGYKILDKTSYFADNKPIKDGLFESENNYKLGMMLREGNNIDLIFQFWNSKWREFLEEILPLFFVFTNFGTRQNKGFGCFLQANMTQSDFEKILKEYNGIIKNVFYSNRFNDLRKVFSEINDIYKILKSGDRNRNKDSELRKYFNDQHPMIEWEKPAIQRKIEEISRQRLKINSRSDNRQFVRAELGLPEIYEYPKHNNIKVQIQLDHSDTKKEIERYASPIFFKVFDKRIYVMAEQREEAKDMQGRTFNFIFSNRGRSNGKITLNTPIGVFDVIDFLDKAMKNQVSWTKI